MEETCPNSSPAKEIIKEEDLNIGWTNKKNVKGADDEKARVKNDEGGVRHLFGSPSKLSQKYMDKIVLKYKITDQYLYRALLEGEYMSD